MASFVSSEAVLEQLFKSDFDNTSLVSSDEEPFLFGEQSTTNDSESSVENNSGSTQNGVDGTVSKPNNEDSSSDSSTEDTPEYPNSRKRRKSI